MPAGIGQPFFLIPSSTLDCVKLKAVCACLPSAMGPPVLLEALPYGCSLPCPQSSILPQVVASFLAGGRENLTMSYFIMSAPGPLSF